MRRRSENTKFEFDRYIIFGENMADFKTLSFESIFWITPIYLRAPILDLTKHHVYLSYHASKLQLSPNI